MILRVILLLSPIHTGKISSTKKIAIAIKLTANCNLKYGWKIFSALRKSNTRIKVSLKTVFQIFLIATVPQRAKQEL